MTKTPHNPRQGICKDAALIRSNKRVLASRGGRGSDFSTPTIKAIYSLKAGGMGATLSNGEKVRLNPKTLEGRVPLLGQALSPHEYESL